LSSDSGLVGAISYQQRNFDLTDFPETFSELVGGQAFRGAGQFFSVNLQPGNEQSRYAVNFREPYLLDSDFFLSSGVFYFERQREDWDERRFGTTLGLGQRFGDVWSAQLAARGELVNLGEISAAGPRDAFAVAGDNVVTSLGPVVTRDTRDSGLFPTQGTQTVLGVHRIGALGGDFNFTRLDGEFHKYWTVDEDFLERRTVLALRVEAGYILEENESPIFERFYAGGHRTIRGFDFRGASPLGLRNDTGLRGDDPVGGDFVFLAGLEYNYPIYSNLLRGVVFVDTGTVDAEPDLSKLRVSVGAGVRLSLPFFGQVPIAIDFAVPLVKEDGDEHRLISFDAALPF
jgi:outer membrane protein insertion porin family